MKSKDNDIWEVISSVLQKETSQEEKHLFDKWISENSGNREVFEVLNRMGYTGDTEHMMAEKDKIFEKIMNKAETTGRRKKIRMLQYLSAASVALLLGVGIWFYTNSHGDTTGALAETRVPYGKQSKIVLSDGTVVNLNSGSLLRYPSTFKGQKIRKVTLEGEAYFEVAKDKTHPFVVNAGSVDVKVLGTHFNVKAYADEGRVTTTLLEGAISIAKVAEPAEKPLLVNPDQQVVFNKNTGMFQVQHVDASLYAGWTEGQYYFDNDSLTFIVKQLERNCNIKIAIRSEFLKSQIFSGSASKEDNIFQILDMMKNYRSFAYKTYKDSIVLFERETN
jgi:transmembrane sensor